MNDQLLQYLAGTRTWQLEEIISAEMAERARRKIAAFNDDDLMEACDYVGQLMEERLNKEGGEQ